MRQHGLLAADACANVQIYIDSFSRTLSLRISGQFLVFSGEECASHPPHAHDECPQLDLDCKSMVQVTRRAQPGAGGEPSTWSPRGDS